MSFEPARPLTECGLENLVALTRLLGYVRHFHPSDAAAAVDWDRFAVAAVLTVEPACDSRELAQTLEALFHPIAPTVQVFPAREPRSVPRELVPPEGAPSLS